jgi:6,7-dimethyl-8-ribityllumazine synthase
MMASSIKGLAPLAAPASGAGKRVAIVRTRWNATVVDALVAGAREELLRSGVSEGDIFELQVPGAYELPFAASSAVASLVTNGSARYDAVICVGCVIKGETMHFEYICEAVTTVSARRRAWRALCEDGREGWRDR